MGCKLLNESVGTCELFFNDAIWAEQLYGLLWEELEESCELPLFKQHNSIVYGYIHVSRCASVRVSMLAHMHGCMHVYTNCLLISISDFQVCNASMLNV